MNNEQREKQIKEAARQRANQYDHPSKWSDTYYGFIDGAKWADSHPAWIPVEKELPKCNIVDCGLATYPVLVYREDGFIDISRYDSEIDEWDCVGVVTHWMPLPTPPQRKEAKNEQD